MWFLLFVRYQVIFSNTHSRQAGFSLLELLVVVSLLAVIAAVGLYSFAGVEDSARDDVANYQMAEIKQALLQFRRDSGSKDFPKQGVYDCDDTHGGDSATPNSALKFPTYLDGLTDAEKVDWCKHPANFWMLLEYPFSDNTYAWSADRQRGWNGPYIRNVNYSVFTGVDLPVIEDPFIHENPYLLVDVDDDASVRLISFGINGNDDGDSVSGDICQPPVDSQGRPLNHVLCLLR